jgi:hypothetical protein
VEHGGAAGLVEYVSQVSVCRFTNAAGKGCRAARELGCLLAWVVPGAPAAITAGTIANNAQIAVNFMAASDVICGGPVCLWSSVGGIGAGFAAGG